MASGAINNVWGEGMKTCKGIVTAEVYVECPHCGHEFDALEHDDDDHGLANAVFGQVGKPARWEDTEYELQCPECTSDFIIERLEW